MPNKADGTWQSQRQKDDALRQEKLRNLTRANDVRFALAALRQKIEACDAVAGRQQLAALLMDPDENVGAAKVGKIIRYPRSVGDIKVRRVLTSLQIKPSSRVRELTDRQRRVLATAVREGYKYEKWMEG